MSAISVYVDNTRRTATITRGGRAVTGHWSHLVADGPRELRLFAIHLQLRACWIHHPGTPAEHYDVTDRHRTLALARGAIAITNTERAYLRACKEAGVRFDLRTLRTDPTRFRISLDQARARAGLDEPVPTRMQALLVERFGSLAQPSPTRQDRPHR